MSIDDILVTVEEKVISVLMKLEKSIEILFLEELKLRKIKRNCIEQNFKEMMNFSLVCLRKSAKKLLASFINSAEHGG